MSRELRVLLISDGVPGHLSQSRGLLQALNQRYTVDEEVLELRLRVKALRPLLRWLANHGPKGLRARLWRIFYRQPDGDWSPPQGGYDLLLSAGGNTLAANLSLAASLDCPNLFSGTPKGYDQRRIAAIFTVTPLTNPLNNRVLDLPPAAIPELPPPSDTPLAALLIGGDGAGYRYDDGAWRALADGVNHLHRAHGLRWLITTSRRTGAHAEEILRNHIDPAAIEQAVWWSRAPDRVVSRFMGESRLVLCTEESLTMVAEAIYSRRPVWTLQPRHMDLVENDRRALEGYAAKGLIQRTPLATLAEQTPSESPELRQLPDVAGAICDAVAQRLGPA